MPFLPMSDMKVKTQNAATHTPAPWSYEKEMVSGPTLTQTHLFAHGVVIGRIYSTEAFDAPATTSQANAAHIVMCVNAHDELVALVEAFMQFDNLSTFDRARALLASLKS